MKGTSSILAALAVIAITTDFRAASSPTPRQSVDKFVRVDGFAFDGPAARHDTPIIPPTDAETMSLTPVIPTPKAAACMVDCRMRVTSEYNPVCGTDRNDYTNPGMLNCAANCGHDVKIFAYGSCDQRLRSIIN